MSDIAIRVEGLSKQYRIGGKQERYKTIRDTITDTLSAPMRALKRKPATEGETFWALRDVSFEVKRGEVVGIIGRNGAGKSTLLKILSRITEPTTGTIDIYGRVGSLLEVGTGFHPELSGRENIFLNGAILGMGRKEIEAKFEEIVAFAEVEKFIDTAVKHYSSGMYLRLAFAVAAHLEPEILIVDEVLAVGDAAFQKKCLGKMQDVAGQGRTVLFVSHSMPAIQRLCSHTVLLSYGRIVKYDKTTNVIPLYLEAGDFTALFWARTTPPKSDFFFEKIWLGNPNGELLQYVATDSSLNVVLEYVITRHCPDLQVGIGLLNAYGEQIFGSAPQDAEVRQPQEAGKYRACMTLPAGLLLAKPYTIRAVLWHPFIGGFETVDAIRFTVAELASLANNTPSGRPGMLAIQCDWSLSQITDTLPE